MSTHLPGFQSFFLFLHNFILTKLATSRIRVNGMQMILKSQDRTEFCSKVKVETELSSRVEIEIEL